MWVYFLFFIFIFSNFSFNFELKKKKPHAKWRRRVSLIAIVTQAVTEPWIDKNWKLDDWIDKTES